MDGFKKHVFWTSGVALFLSWLHLLDVQGVKYVLSATNSKILLPVILSGPFLFLVFRALRWFMVLCAVTKNRIRPFRTFSYSNISYLTNFLFPLHIGELVKAHLLKEREKIPFSTSLTASFIDKGFDFLPVLFVGPLLISTAFSRQVNGMFWAATALFIIFAMILGFLFMNLKKEQTVLVSACFLIRLVPTTIKNKVFQFLERLSKNLNIALREGRTILSSALLVQIFHILVSIFVLYLVFHLLDETVPFAKVVLGYGAVYLCGFLPHPPAHLGSTELIFLFVYYQLLGIDMNVVNTMILLGRTSQVLVFVPLGLFSWFFLGLNVGKLKNLTVMSQQPKSEGVFAVDS